MNQYPFLYGQMLKACDSLHELYCFQVRGADQIPPQLIGNSLYVSAAEMPLKTFVQLFQRMKPYLAWARQNRNLRIEISNSSKGDEAKSRKGPAAGYLLFVLEQAADKLCPVLTEQTRFSDYDKAQLFLGYLASFPKSEKKADDQNAENVTNEGEENDGN